MKSAHNMEPRSVSATIRKEPNFIFRSKEKPMSFTLDRFFRRNQAGILHRHETRQVKRPSLSGNGNKRFVPIIVLLLILLIAGPSLAHDDHSSHMAAGETFSETQKVYDVPAVDLLDQEGRTVRLRPLLTASEKPVVLEFIFATCTTICPVLTATLSAFQDLLGEDAESVQLVSITIDPEHDKPEILGAYGERFDAGAGWLFLTGSRRDIDKVLKSFDVYEPDKMNHRPYVFLKYPDRPEWLRIEGMMGAGKLLKRFGEAAAK